MNKDNAKKIYEDIRVSGTGGTEGWHRLTLYARVLFSDACKSMACELGAFWLMDLIAMQAVKASERHPRETFSLISLTVDTNGGHISVTDGNDTKLLRNRNLEYVDLPEFEYRFYVCKGIYPSGQVYTVMFPEEY